MSKIMAIFNQTIIGYGFYTTNKHIINYINKNMYEEFEEGIFIFIPETLYITESLCEAENIINLNRSYFEITSEQNNMIIQLAKNNHIDTNLIKIWLIEITSSAAGKGSHPSITKKIDF